MATSSSTGELIKLNGDKYPAWKLQVRMALIRDDLWDIVNGSEAAPDASASADVKKKFKTRSNKALSTIVLSMKPKLHYLIGREPEDPVAFWKLLSDHFERKTWVNCYELWKRLMTTPRMKEIRDGGSVDKHLRSMQEVFDSLAVLDDPCSLGEKASYVYTRFLAGIVPNDGHRAGCKHGRRTLTDRREGETQERGAEAETSWPCN